MYAIKTNKHIVLNAYRPPDGYMNEKLWNHLFKKITDLQNEYINHFIILVGDININMLE